MAPLTKAEIESCRKQLTMTLCNLGVFALYWIPSLRRIKTRSTCRAFRRMSTLPADAMLVGYYAQGGIPTREIVQDLIELVAASPDDRAAPAAPGAAGHAQAARGGP